MADLWFALVCLMLTAFVVLDGFDFGAGTLLYALARTDDEKRAVHAAIGPYWDGNEVWLLAAGGSLMVSFPTALAAGLSGFYLGIFLLVWLLIGRAMSIELRAHLPHPLFSSLFDFGFTASSAGAALVLGVALANVVRGVPLDEGGFTLPLFASAAGGAEVGLLDAFTVPAGAFAVLVCATHGAAFVAWKTSGAVRDRARRLVPRLVVATAVGWAAMLALTARFAPAAFAAFTHRPLALGLAALGALALALVRRESSAAAEAAAATADRRAFLASAAFVALVLGAIFGSQFPYWLRPPASSPPSTAAITVASAQVEASSLRTALMWWMVGASLAVSYFVALFRANRRRREDA
ncbi:MAG: cytochrome d ubiquinol oxidase subunit II [Myxococcales bacterium]|jgi:cytochrome d ubiquinol oxidase subunit II|nr:cytochrome d ubiquinol oxidase subunit II [Myxococcales bacterium]